jgi:putative ABC transport system permease protein
MRSARRYLRFFGPDPGADLDDELAFHIDMRVAEYVRLGMTDADARARVRDEAGDMDAARRECLAIDTRELRRQGMREALDTWARDVRVALRSLRRSPGYFAGVVATLALGIGATTAIYSVVHGVLLNPLPYPDAERLTQLWQVNGSYGQGQFSDPNFADVAERTRSFEALAQFTQPYALSAASGDEPFRARASTVSQDFFRALGVRAARGRTFAPDELVVGGTGAVVVTDRFWRNQLGAAEGTVGSRLMIGRQAYTIVGVMEPALDFPAGADIYFPKETSPRSPYRTGHNWQAIGRLRGNTSVSQANAELSDIARSMKAAYGDDTQMTDLAVIPLREQLVGGTRTLLLVLLASAGMLLLIACANVVNLLLARATARRTEIAVRLALGAGRSRLIGQFLAESAVVAFIGGALGVALATVGVRALLRLESGELPRASEIGINLPVLVFALAATAIVAMLLGVIGAIRGGRGALREVMAEGQRSQAGSGASRRLRDGLVIVQIAMSVVLLVGAGLLGRSFVNLFQTNPGFRTEGVLVMDVNVSGGDAAALASNVRFYDELLARGRQLPGVRAAGAVNALPLAPGGTSSGMFIIMNRIDEQLSMDDLRALSRDPARVGESQFRIVGGDYFRAMDIPLIRGQMFEGRDAPDAPHVAVISESLARKRWANEDPIGKIIQYGGMDGVLTPFTIVGVVGDVREASLAAQPQPTFYASYRQRPRMASRMNLMYRTEGDPATLTTALRTAVRELRPQVPPRFRTMETVLRESLATRRFVLVLIGVFGASALGLATLGVYSVIAYLVAQRRREIGVRMALGARPGAVRGMVVRQGVVLAIIGVVIGAAGAIAASRYVQAMLYGVEATDPTSFVGVAFVLIAVAALASWLPARRAAAIAPAEILRS